LAMRQECFAKPIMTHRHQGLWRPRTLSARAQRRSLGGVRVAGPSEHLSGHRLVRCTCLLLTQSGHRRPLPRHQILPLRSPVFSLGGGNEATRVHHISRRRDGSHVAIRCARAKLCVAGYWAPSPWIGSAERQHNSGISRWPRPNRLCCRSERHNRISLGRWPIR
jgi:hypothetical protein